MGGHISIHALLAESDLFWTIFPPSCGNFYPRSPCGERLFLACNIVPVSIFLSTLSLRRATWPGLLARPFFIISIHALLAESDISEFWTALNHQLFLSTLSLRRATRNSPALLGNPQFLSTLSLRRATALDLLGWLRVLISIHALLAESDLCRILFRR